MDEKLSDDLICRVEEHSGIYVLTITSSKMLEQYLRDNFPEVWYALNCTPGILFDSKDSGLKKYAVTQSFGEHVVSIVSDYVQATMEQSEKFKAEAAKKVNSEQFATTVPNMTFPTGAIRGTDNSGVRFDLISSVGLRRLAETYAEGAAKYGDNNWLKGIPASNLLNHLEVHLNKFKSGDTSEDHLAHAAWNLFTLMHFQETRPELIDLSFETLLTFRSKSS